MTGPALLSRLRAAGLGVRARDGMLYVSPPGAVDAGVRSLVAAHKPALLAVVTGRAVASHVPGVVWDPDGGVRLADPERAARVACWREGKRLGFPVAGRGGWASFAATAPIGQVLETLAYLDGAAPAATGVEQHA